MRIKGPGRPAGSRRGDALSTWFALFTVVLVMVWSSFAWADWESLGPEGGEVRHVIQSTLDANTLFGFSDSYSTKVVKSTDGGSTWSPVGTFNNQEYCAVMASNGTIYAGGGHAFMVSTNGGVTWTVNGTSNVYWYGVAVDPTTPTTVYATGYKYNGSAWQLSFMKSTNSGSTWTYTYVGPVNSYGQAIAVSQTNPNVIFVSGYSSGTSTVPVAYRSTDGGASWTDVTPAGTSSEYYSYSVAVSPTDQNLVILGTYYNIYRSTDCGTTWTKVTANQYYNYSIAFSQVDPNYVFAGGYNYVYRSTNAGLTWTTYSSGLPAQYLYTVTPNRTDLTRVYTGTTIGFYRSTTTGTSWTQNNTGLYLGKVYAFGVAPTQPSRVIMQIYGLGIWLTTNNGSSWTHLTTPLSCGDFCGIVFSPSSANTILALEGGG
jgi:photosystem II stability/assembly factor-like uncharacterized protein